MLIRAYLEGKLDHEKMHQLEKQALDDPFLWDAMEGYAHTTDPGAELSILQRQLHKRIAHLQENKKVFDFTWQRLSVAASAAVLFIAAGILFWMNSNRSSPGTQKQVEVTVIDRDSLRAEIRAYENQSAVKEKADPKPSAGKTGLSANHPSGKTKDKNSVNAVSATDNAEIPSAGKTIQATKLRFKDQIKVSSADASSAGVSPSEQSVQPVPGWDIYRQYLEDNIRRPAADPKISGSVLLAFEVDESGRPGNFNVLKGLTDSCNAEAIRLIKDGPAWKVRAGSKITTARIEVIF